MPVSGCCCGRGSACICGTTTPCVRITVDSGPQAGIWLEEQTDPGAVPLTPCIFNVAGDFDAGPAFGATFTVGTLQLDGACTWQIINLHYTDTDSGGHEWEGSYTGPVNVPGDPTGVYTLTATTIGSPPATVTVGYCECDDCPTFADATLYCPATKNVHIVWDDASTTDVVAVLYEAFDGSARYSATFSHAGWDYYSVDINCNLGNPPPWAGHWAAWFDNFAPDHEPPDHGIEVWGPSPMILTCCAPDGDYPFVRVIGTPYSPDIVSVTVS